MWIHITDLCMILSYLFWDDLVFSETPSTRSDCSVLCVDHRCKKRSKNQLKLNVWVSVYINTKTKLSKCTLNSTEDVIS